MELIVKMCFILFYAEIVQTVLLLCRCKIAETGNGKQETGSRSVNYGEVMMASVFSAVGSKSILPVYPWGGNDGKSFYVYYISNDVVDFVDLF